MATAAAVVTSLAAALPAAAQVELYAQGEPYQSGSMTINVVAIGQVGAPVLLTYGLSPLPLLQPIATSKGPYFIGSLLNVLPAGVIGSNGRLDLPSTMPPFAVPGIPVVVQAFVSGSLSNPATLPLDAPYFEPVSYTMIDHPFPVQQSNFGDRVAAGDLDGDGHTDLVANAWYETVAGQFAAGRVYVLWGPGWTDVTVLESESPVAWQGFGPSLTIRDFDKDGITDLLTAKPNGGSPYTPGVHGYLYLYKGGQPFQTRPAVAIESVGTGYQAGVYGRQTRVGDFNADSWLDIAVGVPAGTVGTMADAGRIELFWGPNWTLSVIDNPSPKASDFFGSRLAAADVNGDGITDLVESSGRADVQQLENAGEAHVFLGPTLTLALSVPNPLSENKGRFGEGLHSADLNADGKAEIIAADVKNKLFILWAPDYTTCTLRKRPPTSYVNPFGETDYGRFIGSLDANQDGIADVAVADAFSGALAGCSPAAEGTVYVSLGPYYSTFRVIYQPVAACGDGFGEGLAVVDVDGDGREELMAGAPTKEFGGVVNAGAFYVLWP